MPFFNIHTNVELKDIHKERFLQESLEFLAKELNKPKERIVINYMYNPDILFGLRREDFGALIELKAIGFPPHKAEVALNLTNFINNKLEVNPDHIEIEFVDMPASSLSIAGKLKG